tara:strand:+ start:230 stop:514 length:285 start_codon:yes stop_codon:yes gene_type:complete
MPESKQLTAEELKTIEKLREKSNQKVIQFGEIELELFLAKQRINELENIKKEFQQNYTELQKEERELVETLNEKYGMGTLNVDSGEFAPVDMNV